MKRIVWINIKCQWLEWKLDPYFSGSALKFDSAIFPYILLFVNLVWRVARGAELGILIVMDSSLYENTISRYIRGLTNLLALMNKGEKYAQKKFDTGIILQARLAPDMYNFTQQVQYAYFMALESATLLTGRTMPSEFKYDEKTMDQLVTSVKKTIIFLRSIKPRELERRPKQVVSFLAPKKKINTAFYINHLATPNFFFHIVTAYDILRHLGVPLTKDDYLGSLRP